MAKFIQLTHVTLAGHTTPVIINLDQIRHIRTILHRGKVQVIVDTTYSPENLWVEESFEVVQAALRAAGAL